ncbi:MAG: hypothetical protein MI824_19290 [Hyphomicrobiales bacterium]|nr:hypothetical protein [Hyphomicrobiales bacterium]
MSNGTKLKIFLGALAIANVVVSMMAAPAHAYQCKGGFTTAAAVHPNKSAATSQAVQNWPAVAKGKYGLAWSVWKIAENKGVGCFAVGANWQCVAKAKPCKYVVK